MAPSADASGLRDAADGEVPPHPPPHPPPLRLRGRDLDFGTRTFVMGIVNVTPDSFSGDGLIGEDGPVVERAVAQAVRMVAEGADIIDVGGESTRPGHTPLDGAEEIERIAGVVRAIRDRLPDVPISIDTSKAVVAEAALATGADLLNDVAAVTTGVALASVAAARGAPYILMHGRERPESRDIVGAVVEDLGESLERAVAAGCSRESLIVDPGIGFGKTVEQNLALLAGLAALRALGRPILLGASRKSTIGRILDLPVEERLEGTLAITALAVAAGVDIVRVHDVLANVRVARMSDAIVRAGWRERIAER
jgi:dihydropteroate synthase